MEEVEQTSPGNHFAGVALKASARMNRERDQVVDAVVEAMKPVMREGIRDGINDAMTSQNAATFCRALINEAQTMAAEKSVKVGVSLIKAVVGRVFLFLLLGSLVYAFGGWSGLAAMGKYLLDKG